MKAHSEGSERIQKVVVTRSARGNAELARLLAASGFEAVPIDTLQFRPPDDWSTVDLNLRSLERFDWLLFTSPTGVDFFLRRARDLSLRAPWEGSPSVAAVGEKTADPLRRSGIKVDFVPTEYLAKVLAEQLPARPGQSVLVLRAAVGEPELVPALELRGLRVTDVAIYRTSPLGRRRGVGSAAAADAVVFASPSAVGAFLSRLESPERASELKGLLALCIGPVTAAAAKERGFKRVLTARTHTIEGVLESLRAASAGDGD